MRLVAALALSSLVFIASAGSVHAATLYDATADFSIANTQNGVWTYGYYNVDGNNAPTTFTQFTTANNNAEPAWHGNANLSAWTERQGDSSSYSVVGKNVSGTLQMESPTGSIAVDAGTLFFHPGSVGEKATIRFTAPAAGTIDINATFSADDTSGGDRDVHIFKNVTSSLLGSTVVGSKATAIPTNTTISGLSVNAGDTIDFEVGYGAGGYSNDATGFAGTVNFTALPEPSAALVGMGIAGASMLRRRRLTGE